MLPVCKQYLWGGNTSKLTVDRWALVKVSIMSKGISVLLKGIAEREARLRHGTHSRREKLSWNQLDGQATGEQRAKASGAREVRKGTCKVPRVIHSSLLLPPRKLRAGLLGYASSSQNRQIWRQHEAEPPGRMRLPPDTQFPSVSIPALKPQGSSLNVTIKSGQNSETVGIQAFIYLSFNWSLCSFCLLEC